jgi:hypothetical protein
MHLAISVLWWRGYSNSTEQLIPLPSTQLQNSLLLTFPSFWPPIVLLQHLLRSFYQEHNVTGVIIFSIIQPPSAAGMTPAHPLPQQPLFHLPFTLTPDILRNTRPVNQP